MHKNFIILKCSQLEKRIVHILRGIYFAMARKKLD